MLDGEDQAIPAAAGNIAAEWKGLDNSDDSPAQLGSWGSLPLLL
jgi:hypothetical protein